MLFSLFSLIFTNHFVCCRHSFIQHISHYLLTMFSWTQFHQGVSVYALRQRTLPFWIKICLPRSHHLSISQKWQKLPLILCLHSLACIKWFSPTFLPIFGKNTFPTRQIPKSGLGRIPTIGLPPSPSTDHTLYTSSAVGPTPLHGWDVEGQNLDITLLTCLATLVFSLILVSFSFKHCLSLLLLFSFLTSLC